MNERHDIRNRADIELLVDTFYGRFFQDPLLAPTFEGLDFQAHRPRMVAFWSFVLLNEPGYHTNVFDKHRHLAIGDEHFTRWLELFHAVVDELFIGPVANEAKFRATTIGWTFAAKMKQLRS